ncbi:MAG: hypothetical protein FWG45_05950 [Oscillospiraceae bacterium]|nr:hypothetical protein [Oscillospiraceae bacterium]
MKKTLITLLSVAVAASGAYAMYAYKKAEVGIVEPIVITAAPQELENYFRQYDYWAVLNECVLRKDDFAELTDIAPGQFMDRRAIPYAAKLLETAGEQCINADVLAAYSVGLDVAVTPHEREWFAENSWRFGFVIEGVHTYVQTDLNTLLRRNEKTAPAPDTETDEINDTLRLRYVGVFPAEQMHYSGLSLEDYVSVLRRISNIS